MIKINEASYKYSAQNIFEDISLEINEGEILCIVGPNGCGKTTLLECILGINKLNSGSILIHNTDIKSLKSAEIAKQIAFIPQMHDKTFPYTVREIVIMGRAVHMNMFSSPSRADIEIVDECLCTVGIEKLKDRPYTQLSGGEGQLVMLARALAQKTPLIIMDEPTAHLDFNHELIVLETIVKLVKTVGLTVIMATHFPNHAFYFENNGLPINVGLMNEKKFSEIGAPSRVLNEENLKNLFYINAKVVSYQMENGSELKQIIPISTKQL